MYVITAHQRYRQTDRQTDGRTDVKRSHDRYIAKACSGKKLVKRHINQPMNNLVTHSKVCSLKVRQRIFRHMWSSTDTVILA